VREPLIRADAADSKIAAAVCRQLEQLRDPRRADGEQGLAQGQMHGRGQCRLHLGEDDREIAGLDARNVDADR
jgi:hypothetical protein